ncbi:MAG TPA: hypothetical protein VF921_12985 [Vicinamibacterales bacterium]
MRRAESIIQELQGLRGQAGAIYAVHYACQRLSDPVPAPPEISATGFRDLYSDEAVVFSRVDRPADQERYVLESYFQFLQEHVGSRLIHFKMNAALFSFTVLRNRYSHVVNVNPPELPSPERTFALNALIEESIDSNFADPPQLRSLIDLNRLHTQYFLPGDEEAKRFDVNDHTAIKQSVAEKLDLIAELSRRVIDGDLQTKNAGRRVQFAEGTLDSIRISISVAEGLRSASRPLRVGRGSRPILALDDESDYQDLYHAMLRIFFRDVRTEEFVPSHAGSNSRIDFIVPEVNIAIELKDASRLTDKDVGEQLAIDVLRYSRHPLVRHLVCLVFDYGARLANPAGLERDLSKRHGQIGVTVRVVLS